MDAGSGNNGIAPHGWCQYNICIISGSFYAVMV